MEGTMLLNLQKNMKAGLKKQGHRHLYRFLYIKRDIKKRGYNQAKVIADYLEGETGIPVIDDYLIRIKNTEALKELSAAERKASLEDAFLVSETSKLLYRNLRCVILVDDIYTTGSTINECAATLKKSGVLKVYFLCACIGKDQGGE